MKGRNQQDLLHIKKLAKELRRNSTESEKLLWEYLRNRRFCGYKFLRQHPIIYKADRSGLNYFFADFYCDSKKMVIELDGPIHEETIEYDQFRDEVMKQKELTVLRIKNIELSDIQEVLKKIDEFMKSPY